MRTIIRQTAATAPDDKRMTLADLIEFADECKEQGLDTSALVKARTTGFGMNLREVSIEAEAS